MPRTAPSFVDPFVDPIVNLVADPLVDPVAAPTHPPEPACPPRPPAAPRAGASACPDALLRFAVETGGGSRVNEDGYIAGAPEVVVEVAASSAAYDLNAKMRLYARIGVPEYIVATAHERGLHWFVLTDGAYVELMPDDDGVFRSPLLPGLWLPADAVWADDAAAAVEAVRAGVATDEHAQLIRRLSDLPPE